MIVWSIVDETTGNYHDSVALIVVYEPRFVIKKWGLEYYLGSALKYISRAGKKDPTKEVDDLKKAREFITFRIEELESNDQLPTS